MGKKMKLPFLSKISKTDSSSSSSSWPWPAYCHQPKTLSFRITQNTPTESASFCNESDDEPSLETVIKGLRSERLFFEPGETSSILEEAAKAGGGGEFPFKESVVLSMESQDPYVHFKKSMEEMVEAHGLKDWGDLEELLSCYLKLNAKSNHGFIIGAFVDLLVVNGFAFASSSCSISSSASDSCCCCSRSPSSPLSTFYTSSFSDDSSVTPCVSSLEADEEEIHGSLCLSSLEAQNQIINKKLN